MKEIEVAIIGAGPAGITAAIYAKRKGLNVEIFEAQIAGGTLNEAVLIENYPGFEPISGAKLAEKMISQVKKIGVTINESEMVVSAKKNSEWFELITDSNKTIKAKAVILASGAHRRRLKVAGTEKFEGKGISYCATCDGPLFEGKDVAIIGGGNSGAVNALYMKNIARTVYLIEYMPKLVCETAYIEQLKEKGVKIITSAEVVEFFGKDSLEGLKYKEHPSGEEKTIYVQGVFAYIGIEPHNEIAKMLGCELDEKGYVKVDLKMKTSLPGVFAAGDITGVFQQLIVACGQGAIAAESAYRHLQNMAK